MRERSRPCRSPRGGPSRPPPPQGGSRSTASPGGLGQASGPSLHEHELGPQTANPVPDLIPNRSDTLVIEAGRVRKRPVHHLQCLEVRRTLAVVQPSHRVRPLGLWDHLLVANLGGCFGSSSPISF